MAAVDGVIQYWGHGAPLGGVPHSMDAHREEVIPFPDPSGCTNQDTLSGGRMSLTPFKLLLILISTNRVGRTRAQSPGGQWQAAGVQ